MGGEADAVEGFDLGIGALELRRLREATFFIGIFPDEKCFIDGVQGIDLELIIGISACDKHLYVIILVDGRAIPGEGGLHIWFLHPKSYIEVLIVPEDRGARIIKRRPASDDVGEARRTRRRAPAVLI